MKKIIAGKAYVLGNDLDTNQIIPAKHLVYSLTLKRKKTTVSLLHQVSLKMPPFYLL
jgi:3-isopropylmalate dehydratase small subunit